MEQTVEQHGAISTVMIQSVEVFTFEEAFDKKGVLYHLATHGSTSAYSNPHSSNRVVASLSSIGNSVVPNGCPTRFVQGPSHDGQYNYTNNEANSWMAVDLKRHLAPSHYCLRSEKQSCRLRNWQLEGSKDGASWTCLREHVNDSSLAATPFSVAAWPIDNAAAAHFRHFRILQTGPNSSGHYQLMCAGIEVYGRLGAEEVFAVEEVFVFQDDEASD